MPAQEVPCTECPDDTGTGAVDSGSDFSVRIGNKILSLTAGLLALADVQNPLLDGVYSQVTVVNGQVIDAQDLSPTYTPQTCCDDSGTGGNTGSNTIPLLPDAGNLLKVSGGNYYVKPVFSDTSTVTAGGTGTAADPYNFTAAVTGSGGGSVTVTQGDDIEVTPVTGGFQISQVDSPVGNTTYMGMSINATGHIVATDHGVAAGVAGAHDFGGLSVTISDDGRITSLSGTHQSPGAGGGISGTGVTAGTFTTNDGKTVAYNTDGLITSVT